MVKWRYSRIVSVQYLNDAHSGRHAGAGFAAQCEAPILERTERSSHLTEQVLPVRSVLNSTRDFSFVKST